MIRAKIVGPGGYGGCGLLEIFARHPEVEVTGVIGVSDVGSQLSETVPHLADFYDLTIKSTDDPSNTENVDVVFFSTPDGVGMKGASQYVDKGIKLIDFSGDFRFTKSDEYALYAQALKRDTAHASPDLLPKTCYGVSELHRKEIKKAQIVGNPGCFAISCILGLAPAAKSTLFEDDTIICDCKTGVSGAGKKPSPTFHYPARYENMNAYKLTGHQHVYEIKRELSALCGHEVALMFTPQVIPLCRGIMSTLYVRLKPGVTEKAVWDAYHDMYDGEPFIKLFTPDQALSSAVVKGTNNCYLTIKVDKPNNRLLVISYIDNLMKGQAGSAVQNMNIMFGLPETSGLDFPGMYP
ncbi:MAG: N-acetyl-gamma-glutamyl-phosphate reductase [Candidatus Auribacter fodinae]|jgi:N-acetyl-gamma-glutamyl-phosphate reductase|uniref:N-acetyl-gamma-glutamyl-phosphate reductase n=1 Tax=Candidatus Auribacter fodinae TaxID=2093366 RepID=A0A3A4R1E4_9BACT|nr:MAG: N-acetyl-gamma-glutamyl-phosphate reductase [Candidatus Auribacter fodinae]